MKEDRVLHKYLLILRGLLIGICLTFFLALSLGKISRISAFSDTQQHLILPKAVARQIEVDIGKLVQEALGFYQNGQFAQAIALWQQAATIYQNQKDYLNQALILSYLSLAYQQLGEWSEAKSAIAQSLNLIQNSIGATFGVNSSTINTDLSAKLPPTTQKSKLIFAHILNTQGNLQFAQGKVEAALTTWKQTTDIYKQLKDENRIIGSLINQAQAQQTLGLFLQARQTLNDIEKILQSQPNTQLKAMSLRSLGNIRLLVGDLENSQRVLQQSLAISEQLTLSQDLGATLLSLGNIARVQKDSKTAIVYYQKVVASNVSPLTQAQAQLNQLSLLLEIGREEEAISLIPGIQSLLENLPPSRSTIYAKINFAQSLKKIGNQEAAKTLATALKQAKNLSDRPAEAYTLGYLGGIYEQTQQWAEAQKLTEQALLIAQAINSSEIAYQWQWQLGRILKAQGQIKAAIQVYETAFKTLQSIRSDLVATNPDLQFSFRESVEPVYRQFVDLLLQNSPSQANLQQAREVIESLQLAELDNFFRTACLEGQSVAIDRINQTQSAVIYPIILTNRLEIIVSFPGESLRHYTASVPQQEVEETLEQFRLNLEKPFTSPESKLLGKQIYDWLIRPIETDLTQRSLKTLVFVLDGSFRNVPMATLHDGQQYLIERYSVALTPGLRLLNPQPLQQQKLGVLAAGLTEERYGFSALSNVNSELKEIQTELRSQILLNQDFTSSTLQKQIESLPFPIVHLATHGQFSSNANETFVLAWDKKIDVNELSALLRKRDEVREEAIELLVLSACETAAGDKRAALGLAGVAARAGARSILASLWSLDDESGAQFIGHFYRALSDRKLSKAEALRQAQLTLLRDPNFRHPRYWAPYVLVGNWL